MRRREFFLSSAGLAVAAAETAPPIPTVKFGKAEITRLIVGSNPFYGYSHFNRTMDQSMREWYTQDRRMEVLHAAERNGISAWQLHYDTQPMADLARYRAEGGKMHLILLADFELMRNPKLLPDVAKLGPLGIAHHGNRTDERFRNGEKHLVKDFLKAVRDTGVLVGSRRTIRRSSTRSRARAGISTTTRRVSIASAGHRRRSRAQFGEAPVGETFMEKDPERMCKMLRQTKRPCLAFKLLGAGRTSSTPAQVEKAFRFAYANIKPGDAAIIGLFPRYRGRGEGEHRPSASYTRGRMKRLAVFSPSWPWVAPLPTRSAGTGRFSRVLPREPRSE